MPTRANLKKERRSSRSSGAESEVQEQASAPKLARPGAAIRALRAERGWTLTEVSRRTGLPLSTLSKIENDKMSLSYDKITQLCAGLGVDIARLFVTDPKPVSPVAAATAMTRRSISRAGEGSIIETDSYIATYPVMEVLNKKIVPILTEVKARSREQFGELLHHSGEEYTFVLEGQIEFHTELYAPVLLDTGDSIYFDSNMGHAYIGVGPGTCRVLTVCSADSTELRDVLTSANSTSGRGLHVVRRS
jgi:transcriptional regulator with XRE-family HTH domain